MTPNFRTQRHLGSAFRHLKLTSTDAPRVDNEYHLENACEDLRLARLSGFDDVTRAAAARIADAIANARLLLLADLDEIERVASGLLSVLEIEASSSFSGPGSMNFCRAHLIDLRRVRIALFNPRLLDRLDAIERSVNSVARA